MAPVPTPIRKWTSDIPNGDLDELLVYPDGSVLVATGRYAHSSGAMRSTWTDFLDGCFDDLVTKRHGADVLSEAKALVRERINAAP
jgi:hypothetical protein